MVASIIFGRKDSKSIKDKNLIKINDKFIMEYPLIALKNSGVIDKMYVSSDSDEINKIAKTHGCESIFRPKELSTDNAQLLDVINYSFKKIKKLNKNLKYLAINLCNAPNINSTNIKLAFEKLQKNKELDSVITVSRYEMFSPERARKTNSRDELIPYIPFEFFPNEVNCDRKSHEKTFFADGGLTLVRVEALENFTDNLLPFQWMGKKIGYIEQLPGGGDIDYPWQIEAVKWWLEQNKL